MTNSIVSNQALLNGKKSEVTQKLLKLKNSKIFEDEQSFIDAIIEFIQTTVADDTEYIMVTIDTLNGKIDQITFGINQLSDGMKNLKDDMRDQFKFVHQRLDGVDKRLDGVDKRLDGLDGRLKSVEEDTKIIRTVVSGAKKIKDGIFKR